MLDEGYEPVQESAKAAVKLFLAENREDFERPPWHRQYMFVAATVPSDAKKNVANDIKRLVPDVEWATSPDLHRISNNVEHNWVDISQSSPQKALLESLLQRHGGRTLVFARDVVSAEQIWEGISRAGFKSVLYHSKMRAPESEKNLVRFRQNMNMIMVCTDAASRGLDVPNVSNVVQADFAASAVDFLHRVGRTGRAGAPGHVTSLFGDDNRNLVEAIRCSIEKGEPIEGAFSRKRSFRKKFKRYGRYVPRGEVAISSQQDSRCSPSSSSSRGVSTHRSLA